MRDQSPTAWRRCRLGDLLRIKHGFAFKGEFFRKEGDLVVLTPGNFREDGGLKLEGEQKYYKGEFPGEFLLKRGELLVVMTDLTQDAPILGSPAFIPEDSRYLHNQRLGKVTDVKEAELDRAFLFYLLNTRNVRSQIKGSASGATVKHTAPDRIYAVRVCIPPVDEQRKIGAILSAYDHLSENNARRIGILEEMIRAVYREWFVDFRAPGVKFRKATPMERRATGKSDFPIGWELRMLGDLAEEVRKGIQPDEVDPGTPYIGLEHLPRRSIAVAEWGEARQVHSTKLAFRAGDILFGKIRPYFHKVGIAPLDGICSSDTIVIGPKSTEYHALVLACVSSDAFVKHATQTSQGSKMPRANWQVLVKYPVAVPGGSILREFDEHISAATKLIHNLIFVDRNLKQTRDLLLPRLMSGEATVENLKIATAEVLEQEVTEVSR